MRWPMVALGEVAEMVGGSTPRRDNPEYWGKGYFWATPTDLPMPGEGILELEHTAGTITEAGLRSCSANLLPEGSVLFSTRATIGKLAIARVPVATNQGFTNFIAGPPIYNRYLAYALQRFTPEIAQLAGSTTFKEVSKSALKAFRIPLPLLSEQRRIVEILDEADRLRKLRREVDAKATRILPALFIKMFGDPATNPRGWPEMPLQEVIAEVEAGWSAVGEARKRKDHEFGVLKVSAVTTGCFLPDEHKAVSSLVDGKPLIVPRRGDLLFSRANTRELVAASCVVEQDQPKLFLPDKLWRIIPKSDRTNSFFLKELFWNDSVRNKFRASASGSSGSMLNISQKAVLQTHVPIPPFDLQERFSVLAWDIARTIRDCRQAAEKVNELWDVLLQRAFSGQLTTQWREAHFTELLTEMKQQIVVLG